LLNMYSLFPLKIVSGMQASNWSRGHIGMLKLASLEADQGGVHFLFPLISCHLKVDG
jgi:hypothetical protein